jgi:hypothetical protein
LRRFSGKARGSSPEICIPTAKAIAYATNGRAIFL